MRLPAFAFVLLTLAPPALAHPHIFIETGLKVEVDDAGQAVAVEVTWVYDELYSLLIFEEYAVDDDYDGVLKPVELATLAGFDMQWVEGYEGDLYVTRGETPVTLGPPEPVETRVEDGKIVTVHRRALGGVPANGLVLQAYDPGFYSAYDLSRGVEATGTCAVFIDPADITAATDKLEELLFAAPQDQLEDEFPQVGKSFADTVTLTCD
jgi:ABC-type uncharacterized transport system substrate-binding protein